MVEGCHNTWDLHLPAIRWAMNSTPSSVTGFSPILLTFGRQPRQPRDSVADFQVFCHDPTFVRTPISVFLQEISLRMLAARDSLEKAQDNRRHTDSQDAVQTYQEGDQILLKTHPQSSKARAFSAKPPPREMAFILCQKYWDLPHTGFGIQSEALIWANIMLTISKNLPVIRWEGFRHPCR